jgi:TPR repeat protein
MLREHETAHGVSHLKTWIGILDHDRANRKRNCSAMRAFDLDMAIYWCKVAAEHENNVEAQSALAVYFHSLEPSTENTLWVLRNVCPAAQQYNAAACALVAEIYWFGLHNMNIDAHYSFYWTMQAAKQNHVFSMHNLGYMYDRGHGVLKNSDIAFGWYAAAAKLGCVASMYAMSFMFRSGSASIVQDHEIADALHDIAVYYRWNIPGRKKSQFLGLNDCAMIPMNHAKIVESPEQQQQEVDSWLQ